MELALSLGLLFVALVVIWLYEWRKHVNFRNRIAELFATNGSNICPVCGGFAYKCELHGHIKTGEPRDRD